MSLLEFSQQFFFSSLEDTSLLQEFLNGDCQYLYLYKTSSGWICDLKLNEIPFAEIVVLFKDRAGNIGFSTFGSDLFLNLKSKENFDAHGSLHPLQVFKEFSDNDNLQSVIDKYIDSSKSSTVRKLILYYPKDAEIISNNLGKIKSVLEFDFENYLIADDTMEIIEDIFHELRETEYFSKDQFVKLILSLDSMIHDNVTRECRSNLNFKDYNNIVLYLEEFLKQWITMLQVFDVNPRKSNLELELALGGMGLIELGRQYNFEGIDQLENSIKKISTMEELKCYFEPMLDIICTWLKEEWDNHGSLKESTKKLFAIPFLKEKTKTIRIALLGSIQLYAEKIDEPPQPSSSGKFISPIIALIVGLKNKISKAQMYLMEIRSTFSDLEESTEVEKVLLSAKESMVKKVVKIFDSWVSLVQKLMQDSSSALHMKKSHRLLEISSDNGKLRVNFQERLVSFMNETRQFSALGFNVPKEILDYAKYFLQMRKFGVSLKQIAEFHNSLEFDILSSQKPLLLKKAVNFDNLIKNPKAYMNSEPNWENLGDLERYVKMVQAAANELANENKKLREINTSVLDKILFLSEKSLLDDSKTWKETISDVRIMISELESAGYSSDSMKMWILHLDCQLYKIFDCRYSMELKHAKKSNLRFLSKLTIDVSVRQNSIILKPPIEDIRSKLFKDMKRLIGVPYLFRGFGSDLSFENVVQKHYDDITDMFALLNDWINEVLNAAKTICEGWPAFEKMQDLDQITKERLSSLSCKDWIEEFKFLKEKVKESERFLVTYDCKGPFVLNLVTVRNIVEDNVHFLFESSVSFFRQKITNDFLVLDTYVNQIVSLFTNEPNSIEEVSAAQAKHISFSQNKQSIIDKIEDLMQMNKYLKSLTGLTVDFQLLVAKWEKLLLVMEAHQKMINEKQEGFKSEISNNCLQLDKLIESFVLRWKSYRFDSGCNFDDARNEQSKFESYQIEFQDIKTKLAAQNEQNLYFGLSVHESEAFQCANKEMQQLEIYWKNFNEFLDQCYKIRSSSWDLQRFDMISIEKFIEYWRFSNTNLSPQFMAFINFQLDHFEKLMPILKILKGEGWSSDHWIELSVICKFRSTESLSTLNLKKMIDNRDNMIDSYDKILDLNSRAAAETSIQKAIDEIEIWAAGASLELYEYHSNSSVVLSIVKDFREAMSNLDDYLALVQSVKNSSFTLRFKDRILIWEERLENIQACLKNLSQCQRKWLYLEPIFSRKTYMMEAKEQFNEVNTEIISIYSHLKKDPRYLHLLNYSRISEVLTLTLEKLEKLQKRLSLFLESKRSKFPRFYFIGDEDLLEMIGQSDNPEVVQNHLKKLYGGMESVIFNQEKSHIISFCSAEGEVLNLVQPVPLTSEIEEWLQKFTQMVRSTLSNMLSDCLKDKMNIFSYCQQIVSLGHSVYFTSSVENALNSPDVGNSLEKLRNHYKQLLSDLVHFDYSKLKNHQEVKLYSVKVKSLILEVIHFNEVLVVLENAKCTQINDWNWQKQMRFYIKEKEKENLCVVKMADAELEYTFEYQGNQQKLVYTPLTDKCFITLTQAIRHGYGGNPFGVAATGKTESVKALGQYLGRQVLVFNCDEGIDYKAMGRIFTGIVKTGSYACFDEFNRLDESVMSMVAEQISAIQTSLRAKRKNVELNNQQVDLDFNCGIFVTLNPAGKGYGGRRKLPESLKQLFRPIAMTSPDVLIIATVSLISEGFGEDSKSLAKKILNLFEMAKVLVSNQKHYDWSLRSLKPILSTAGKILLQKNFSPLDCVTEAIRANIASKLSASDISIVHGLMGKIFGKSLVDNLIDESFRSKVIQAMKNMNLIPSRAQVIKAIQLKEIMEQRMGVLLMGQPFSGKTTTWKVLLEALKLDGNDVKTFVINPKSINRNFLLGEMNADTREWCDGILTSACRKAAQEPLSRSVWIICDGDIDYEWIESLNSVLDDNRLLTIQNGERIRFGKNINFLFETHELRFASPATVSRMGIVFMSDTDLPSEKILSNKELSGLIANLKLNKNIADILPCKVSISSVALNILQGTVSEKEAMEDFMLSFPVENRRLIDKDWESNQTSKESVTFDYKDQFISDINVVVTPHLQYYTNVVSRNIINGKFVLLVGKGGVGKSKIGKYFGLSKYGKNGFVILNCNAYTSSSQILKVLQEECTLVNSSKGKHLKPRNTPKLLMFIEDIHLPNSDQYGTIQICAFLHQIICYQGYYSTENEWIQINDIEFLCSMTFGSQSDLSRIGPRLMSKLILIHVDIPSEPSTLHLFSTYLRNKSVSETESCLIGKLLVDTKNFINNEIENNELLYSLTDGFKVIESFLSFSEILDLSMSFDFLVHELLLVVADKMPLKQKECFVLFVANWMKTNLNRPFSGLNFINIESQIVSMNASESLSFVESNFKQYIKDVADINVFLTEQFVANYIKLHCALSKGNVFIVGKSGTGRATSLKITCYCLKLKLIKLVDFPGYSVKSFISDFRLILQQSIKEPVCLLLNDFQLSDEILNNINGFLSSGDISFAYGNEEMSALFLEIKENGEKLKADLSNQELILLHSKTNLKFVFLMDSSDLHSNVLVSYPGIRKSCLITKFDEIDVRSAVNLISSKTKISEALLQKSADIIINDCSMPPIKFWQFISHYDSVYSKKSNFFCSKKQHYQRGLNKILDAKSQIDELGKEAERQKDLFSQKQREADGALEKISNRMAEASNQRVELESLTKKLGEEETAMHKRKQLIENQLQDVEPAIQRAKEAVGEIRNDNLAEIRSLRSPPALIRDLLEGVLSLMGIYDTSWSNMKSFLGKRTVKEEIMNFDARKITKEIRSKVEQIMKEKPDAFEESLVRKSFVAAAPLASWVKANIQFSIVLEQVVPLERDLDILESSLITSKKRANELKKDLGRVDSDIEELKSNFAKTTGEAESLKFNLSKTTKLLENSIIIIEKLQAELSRWQDQINIVDESLEKIYETCTFCALMILFGSSRNERNRSKFRKLLEDKITTSISLAEFLSSELEIFEWKTRNLPNTKCCIENIIAIKESKNSILINDPSGVAISFLSSNEKKFDIVSQSNGNIFRSVDLALRFGKSLIVLVDDYIETSLYPLIKRDFTKRGDSAFVQFGDKSMPIKDDFQLILITNERNLAVHPSLDHLLIRINFEIDSEGLAEQLLSEIVKNKNPDLENNINSLLNEEGRLKREMDSEEKMLLEKLNHISGNILEDQEFLETLMRSKEKSANLTSTLLKTKEIKISLLAESEAFSHLALFASRLYFSVNSLQEFNRSYGISSNLYLSIFRRFLNSDLSKFGLFNCVYELISRSIFNGDHHFVIMSLFHDLFETDEIEWKVWLDISEGKQKELGLSQMFKWLDFNDPNWREWIINDGASFNDITVSLTDFQKLIVVSLKKPGKTLNAIEQFATKTLKIKSIYPSKSFSVADFSPSVPILLVVNSSASYESFLTEQMSICSIKASILIKVAVGSDSFESDFKEKIKFAAANGNWLLVDNLHLSSHNVYSIIEKSLATLDCDARFRLWLSTEASDILPESFMRNCVKIVFEVPAGLKDCIIRNIHETPVSLNENGSVMCSQALFLVAWLHSIVFERSHYIPIGWNKDYEFGFGDFKIACSIVKLAMQNQCGWNWIIGLLVNAVYGSRIDNEYDLSKLYIYLNQIFSDEIAPSKSKTPIRKLFKGMTIPSSINPEDYVNAITTGMKELDDYSILSLPKNLSSILCEKTTKETFEKLKLISMESNIRAGQVNNITTIEQVFSGFLETCELAAEYSDKFGDKKTGPMVNCLREEFLFGFQLLEKMKLDIKERNISLIDSIKKGKTPESWLMIWDGPMKLSNFLKDVREKILFIASMATLDNDTELIAKGIELKGLFNYNSILVAMKTKFSETKNDSIEDMELFISKSPKQLYLPVRSLFLQGSQLISGGIENVLDPNLSSFCAVPEVYIGWVAKFEESELQSIPLYDRPDRLKYSRMLTDFRIDKTWVLTGTAFFVNINE